MQNDFQRRTGAINALFTLRVKHDGIGEVVIGWRLAEASGADYRAEQTRQYGMRITALANLPASKRT